MGFLDRILGSGSGETPGKATIFEPFLEALKAGDFVAARAGLQDVPRQGLMPGGETVLLQTMLAANADQTGVDEFIGWLLQSGFSADQRNSQGMFPLLRAVTLRKRGWVKLLLEAGANPDAALPNGEMAILEALRLQEKEVAEMLLERGKNLFNGDQQGNTPLHFAVLGGYRDLVSRLVARGSLIEKKNRVGRSPLDLARAGGDAAMLRLLWLEHARLKSAHAWSEMYDAVQENHLEKAQGYADAGLISEQSHSGATLLFYAQHAEMVDFLTTVGLDIHHRDKEKKTALHAAVEDGRLKAVGALLKQGADPNAVDAVGRTPYDLAQAKKEPRPEMLMMLKEAGGREKPADPLWSCLKAGSEADLERLLSQGVAPNVRDSFGRTPLHFAVQGGSIQTVRLLLGHGADADVVHGRLPQDALENHGEWSVLHYAVERGELEILALILNAGPKLDRKAWLGDTPMLVAINRKNVEAVRLLLNAGLSLKEENSGISASLSRAAERGTPEIVTLLLDHGADPDGKDPHGTMALDFAANLETKRLIYEAMQRKALANGKPLVETRDLCHVCRLPFFHGTYLMSYSETGHIGAKCSLCGVPVCRFCAESHTDSGDDTWKVCLGCMKKYGLSRDRVTNETFHKTVQKLGPEFAETSTCPVCGKNSPMAQVLAEWPACSKCLAFYCPDCEGAGTHGGGYCRTCGGADQAFWTNLDDLQKKGKVAHSRVCARCGRQVEGIARDAYHGVYTRGTIDCMTCGKEICTACGKTIIKSGKMTQYCLDCLKKR